MPVNARKIFTLILFVVFLSGCAVTQMESFVDPVYRGQLFNRILIVIPFNDLAKRAQMERSFAICFNQTNTVATASIDLMPPIRDYSQQEIEKITKQNNIDGIITLSIMDAYVEKTYIPGSSRTTTSGSMYGGYFNINSTTTDTPGYTLNSPVMKFEVKLYETNKANIVWVAGATTSGSPLTDLDGLITSLANEVINNMVKNGFVQRPILVKTKNTWQ